MSSRRENVSIVVRHKTSDFYRYWPVSVAFSKLAFLAIRRFLLRNAKIEVTIDPDSADLSNVGRIPKIEYSLSVGFELGEPHLTTHVLQK